MNRYIILLRGVNVGGKNLLPMKELKALLENSGFNNVTTYIQSGNLLLTGHEHPEKQIRELIQTHFGFTPETLVLTKDEFKLAISNCPFQKGNKQQKIKAQRYHRKPLGQDDIAELIPYHHHKMHKQAGFYLRLL